VGKPAAIRCRPRHPRRSGLRHAATPGRDKPRCRCRERRAPRKVLEAPRDSGQRGSFLAIGLCGGRKRATSLAPGRKYGSLAPVWRPVEAPWRVAATLYIYSGEGGSHCRAFHARLRGTSDSDVFGEGSDGARAKCEGFVFCTVTTLPTDTPSRSAICRTGSPRARAMSWGRGKAPRTPRRRQR